ncbi:MAG: MFS transporter [Marinobacter sp.]|uniref:MFS transporter n=1 Tax=Marinobacter sp. TaxID=50741 RepID=UPI00299DD8F8|nr:MFS transporter [Marinobacter sp.]MDX1756161.1 MFS transporter [Marinobacter sp.]
MLFVCGFFFRFAPATMASSIQQELGLSVVMLGLVASMHFWAYTLAQVPAGVLADGLGVRSTALLGGTVTIVGAVLFALATDLTALLVGCGLMGLGLAAVFSGLMRYNAVCFPANQHARVVGVTMLLAAAGSIAAEGPTALLLTALPWRTLILATAGVALIAVLLLVQFCRHPPTQLPGRNHSANSGLPGMGKVMGERQVWLLLLCVGGTNGTLYAFVGLWAVPMMTDGFAIPHTQAAWYPTVTLAIYGVGSLCSGWLADRLQARKPLIVAAAALSVVAWGAMACANWRPGWGALTLFVLLGLSGAQVAVIFSATRESVALSHVGVATALVNMGAFLFAALVQAGFGALLEAAAQIAGDGQLELPHYRLALLLPLGISLMGLAAAMKLQESAHGHALTWLRANARR